MNNIQVSVLAEGHQSPGGMMMFLARLTQRGHNVKSMDDLLDMYNKAVQVEPVTSDTAKREKLLKTVAGLPHGTITRFSPITVAIVGASRRFLAQARTHQVGMTYVSASLQYSDYSDQADFVVPYELIERDSNNPIFKLIPGFSTAYYEEAYLGVCRKAMNAYKSLVEAGVDNDTAGYMAPQGLRNILIVQGNTESWAHFIRMRSCNRNTLETQYVALKIWEELLQTVDGDSMFCNVGPDCLTGKCREGKFSCGKPMKGTPTELISTLFPKVKED